MQESLQHDVGRSLRMRRARLGCCVLLLACLFRIAAAQPKPALTPDDVEAAYLYNFGKFVAWPPEAGAGSRPFSICILGRDDFGGKLDGLIAGETIQGRRIVARRLPSVATADSCQIVFIGESEEAHLVKDLDALARKPVLTVSSLPVFLNRGGMIQFVLENNRVRFAVNLPAAQETGLSLSSELLKVAVYVRTGPKQEGKP